MIRGTTAQFKIQLPYTRGELEWITIKWWQDGNNGTMQAPLPITKKLAHCSASNIYLCELQSDIELNKQYYFVVDNIKYVFTAPKNVGAGASLKYNSATRELTIDSLTLTPNIIEDVDDITALTFIHEMNDSKELYVTLTAEETRRFSDRHKAKMQLRGKLKSNGVVFGCKPRLLTVYPINDDLVDDTYDSALDNGWVTIGGGSITTSDGELIALDSGSIADADEGWIVIGGESVIGQ
jgi:hypothetical protein